MNRRRTRNYLSFSWYFLNKIEKLFSFSSIGRLPLQPFLEWQFVKSDFSNHGFSSFQPLDGKNDVLDIKLDSNRGHLILKQPLCQLSHDHCPMIVWLKKFRWTTLCNINIILNQWSFFQYLGTRYRSNSNWSPINLYPKHVASMGRHTTT